MERRDLIQDQIDQLGAVLANMLSKILGLKNQALAVESVQVVNQDLKDTLGIDDFLSLSSDELLSVLEKNPNFNSTNLEKLANNVLLIAESLDTENSKNLYQKSFLIFELINRKELTYSHERFTKMKNIEAVLENYKALSS
ncbi:hypothetical protein [Flavobacterium sp.]|uniref:hypothetical protein n=1 Tax=Flavobacterium sp. TaxID=239 RepID=UPI00286DD174|nr:hypothetical protein [Flavobacterium sp.]